MVFIKEIESIHNPVYGNLAARAGTVFNSPAWLTMYGNKLQLFGIYCGDNELAGAFFLYRDRRVGFSFFKNPPFTPHIGWMFENSSQNHASALSQNKNAMEAIANFMQERAVGIVSCSFPFSATDISKTTYYLLGGYDPATKHGGAGILCMWQSILHAKGVGLDTFDFEGCMLPEVERFFRGFGADLVPYFTVNKAWLPLEFMLKIFKRERF